MGAIGVDAAGQSEQTLSLVGTGIGQARERDGEGEWSQNNYGVNKMEVFVFSNLI